MPSTADMTKAAERERAILEAVKRGKHTVGELYRLPEFSCISLESNRMTAVRETANRMVNRGLLVEAGHAGGVKQYYPGPLSVKEDVSVKEEIWSLELVLAFVAQFEEYNTPPPDRAVVKRAVAGIRKAIDERDRRRKSDEREE